MLETDGVQTRTGHVALPVAGSNCLDRLSPCTPTKLTSGGTRTGKGGADPRAVLEEELKDLGVEYVDMCESPSRQMSVHFLKRLNSCPT